MRDGKVDEKIKRRKGVKGSLDLTRILPPKMKMRYRKKEKRSKKGN